MRRVHMRLLDQRYRKRNKLFDMAQASPFLPILVGDFSICKIVCVILVLLCAKWIYVFVQARILERAKAVPPGPMSLPLIGCTLQLIYYAITNRQRIHQVMQRLAEDYGPVCYLRLLFGHEMVIISNNKEVQEALTSKELNYRPSVKFEMFHSILKGKGVFFSSDELWNEHRRFALNTFRRFGIGQRSFEDQIATEASCLIEVIDSFGGSKPFNPQYLLNNAAANVICSVTLGRRFDYGDPAFQHLHHLLRSKMASPFILMLPLYMPWLFKVPFFPTAPFKCMVELRQTWERMVEEHRQTFDEDNPRDFIDMYIKERIAHKEHESGTFLDSSELYAVLDDLFLAGMETTATTLSWCLYQMLRFPEVQKRVHEELDKVVGRERLPTLSDKSNLHYTQAVIKEVQRHSRMVYITLPRYARKDESFQGFTIPKGSDIVINMYSVMSDPTVWKDPSEFQPKRFLDEDKKVTGFNGLSPFGSGRRVCLGEHLAKMELFIIFTHLMHRYSFRKISLDTELPSEPTEGGVLTPQPYQLIAVPR